MKLNLMMQSFTKLGLLFFTLGFFIFGVQSAHAQTPPINIPAVGAEFEGYMWSDTIGWISMNCKTGGASGESICPGSPGAGPKSNYKVKLVGTDTGTENVGDLQGYAWSSNIGWIKFSRQYLNSFPVAAGNVQTTAKVTGDFNGQLELEGWSRACAGTAAGSCGNMNSRTDGWDGWISMKGTGVDGGGTAFSYGAKFSAGGTISNSFAWGGTVVGWLNLDQGPNPVTYTDLSPKATLTVIGCDMPADVPLDSSNCDGKFTWNITNTTNQSLRNDTGNNNYSTQKSGNSVSYPLTFGDNIIQARGDSAAVLEQLTVKVGCVSGTAQVGNFCRLIPPIVAPTVTLSLNKKIARSGDVVTATWSITPAPPASPASCTLTGPGLTGTTVTSSGSKSSTPLKSKTRFTINCTGTFGTVSAVAEIEVIPVAMEV